MTCAKRRPTTSSSSAPEPPVSTAAVTAALDGASVLVIESAATFGGSTAFSGGAVWIPANHYLTTLDLGWYQPNVGLADTAEKGATYLRQRVGPTVTDAQIAAFLESGPRMLKELEERIGLKWLHWALPDYHSEAVGGMSKGRTLEPAIFDGRRLGDQLRNLRPPSDVFTIKGLTMTCAEGAAMSFGPADQRALIYGAQVAARMIRAKLTGARPLSCGQALVAHLRTALIDLDVPVWLSAPMDELILADVAGERQVTGVRCQHDGRVTEVRAARGVVLATGGFARSQDKRDRYLPKPTRAEWSLVPKDGQDGDGLDVAETAGAALALTDRAWGFPTVLLPNRDGELEPGMAMLERMKPGVIVVNAAAERYFDEGMPYEDTWKAMYAANTPEAPTIPSVMIFDSRAKRRYTFFKCPPLVPFPRRWIRSGAIQRATTLRELADKMGLPPAALEATVQRHNELARNGHDDDFGKGDTAFCRFLGDRRAEHPNLAPIERGPFYAVQMYPGDISTKGGVVIDERARALTAEGQVIPGLYACGNTSASIMGDTYPGGGGTIAPAMTMGYIAAKDMSAAGAVPASIDVAESVRVS